MNYGVVCPDAVNTSKPWRFESTKEYFLIDSGMLVYSDSEKEYGYE